MLRAAAALVALSGLLVLQGISATYADGTSRFEVASIRRNLKTDVYSGVTYKGETFRYTNASVGSIIRFAYGVGLPIFERPFAEVEGEPRWAGDRYDIEAKTDGALTYSSGVVGPVQRMLQSLLADRFKLAVHWEMRERAVYALVRPKDNGVLASKIRSVDSTICETYRAALRKSNLEGTPRPAAPTVQNPRMVPCGATGSPDEELMSGLTMRGVADTLARRLRQPIIDETGLVGAYDIELTFPRSSLGTSASTVGDRLSVPDAVREQLNLRLERRRGMVDVLVIDQIERPTED